MIIKETKTHIPKKSLPVKLLSRVQILHLLVTSSLPPGGESNVLFMKGRPVCNFIIRSVCQCISKRRNLCLLKFGAEIIKHTAPVCK